MSECRIDDTILDAAEKGAARLDDADAIGPLGICDTATLVFSGIRYRVPSAKGGKVTILNGVSGFCRGGRLLALMGASGIALQRQVSCSYMHKPRNICIMSLEAQIGRASVRRKAANTLPLQ